MDFKDYLDKALEEDDELRKEYDALEEEYEIIKKRMKEQDAEYDFAASERPATLYISKIKNGSMLSIGDKLAKTQLKVDQHFNWFQKLMWKWCFGVKVENYNEE